MVNRNRFLLIGWLAAFLGFSGPSSADDIDIYSGLAAGGANTPNLMFVIDSSANSDASFGSCSYDQARLGDGLGGAPSNGSKTLGNEQCALVNIAQFLPTRSVTDPVTGVTSLVALIRLGITTSDGVYFQLVPIDDNAYSGPSTTGGGTNIAIPSGLTNRQAFVLAAKNLPKHTASVDQGDMMQETWAYYTGGDGPTSVTGMNGSTGTGMISGVSFSGTNAATGCQKNYDVFLGATASSSHVNDAGNAIAVLTSAVTNYENSLVAAGVISQAKANANISALTTVISNGAQPDKYASTPYSWAREWARFMFQADANSASTGTQNIITYSVSVGGGNADMANFTADLANFGGGKPFTAATYTDIFNSILKILNEVQAVNSVFASSSLPVSVNAQGTFLNQIYMGMFRPDPSGNPRWMGNLKQYQFILDPATGALQLGDSLGNLAISSAGTGFISPNAISFWSCTDLTTSPYPNPYLTATPANLSAAQISLLQSNNQNCADPANGFWVNDPGSATSIAQGFDLPDGERVERGGMAQQVRNNNLTDDYAASPAAPRHLYTYCPSRSGCVADLTDASNAFATTNSAITASMFGTTQTANISSITRSGATATVATTGNHGFNSGDSIDIENASPNDYDGIKSITVVDATHFTYPVAEYPPTPASGSYTSQKAGIPFNVTSLSRSGNTVTAITSSIHGFPNGTTVIIANAVPNDYNGSFTITSVPTLTSFTYTVAEQPPTAGGGGTAASVYKTTGAGCPCSNTVNINATPTGVTRALGSSTVTVNTGSVLTSGSNKWTTGYTVTLRNVVDSSGTLVNAYNGSFTITGFPTSTSFTFSVPLSPATPATVASGFPSITASLATTGQTITGLTRADMAGTTTATVTATTAGAHGYATGDNVSIGGAPGVNEQAYLGTYAVTVLNATQFTYTITTTPVSPASALTGATVTATRSTGFQASDLANLTNWVRGQDNQGDEKGPGGTITIRPSVHGDVLHSRPTVINYGSYPVGITATSDSGSTRTATASVSDVSSIRASGAAPIVTFANMQACPVTVASATTFTYAAKNCGAAGAQNASVGSKVVVFYGDNGGVFHAVNGNQSAVMHGAGPGDEMWGFIPQEFFIKLSRLRTDSPQLNLPSTPPGILPAPQIKDYFVDGIPGVYQVIDGNGNTTQAIIYLAMRRGGSFLYALDVSDPSMPKVVWKVDSTSPDMGELGQTWSQPKVIAKLPGYANPVLVFGGGYDTAEDSEPIASGDTKGRAIFILDALTGSVVWSARNSCTGVSTPCQTVAGMDYSIPADVGLFDRDFDGVIDRIYAADAGGNVWRVDLESGGNNTPQYWRVNHLAALGCSTGACAIPSNPTQRKFFYPPELIPATAAHPYDAVIVGTGDREHPLYVSTSTQRYNRVFLLKDPYTGSDATGMSANVITMTGTNGLFDATNTPWDGSLNGYYITLGPGEKVVTAPLAVAGSVYLSTNTPASPSANSCTSNLGTAKGYNLSPFTGTYTNIVFAGGGLPPSPVAGVVNIVVGGVVKQVPFVIGGTTPGCVGPGCSSPLSPILPAIAVPTNRTRTYWYIEGK